MSFISKENAQKFFADDSVSKEDTIKAFKKEAESQISSELFTSYRQRRPQLDEEEILKAHNKVLPELLSMVTKHWDASAEQQDGAWTQLAGRLLKLISQVNCQVLHYCHRRCFPWYH